MVDSFVMVDLLLFQDLHDQQQCQTVQPDTVLWPVSRIKRDRFYYLKA
jgi:hypothetical protein